MYVQQLRSNDTVTTTQATKSDAAEAGARGSAPALGAAAAQAPEAARNGAAAGPQETNSHIDITLA